VFEVGEKIVCVNAGRIDPFLEWSWALMEGAVYTVTKIGPTPIRNHLNGSIVVWLAEAENLMPDGRSVGFAVARFRRAEKRNDRLTIEAFMTVPGGWEEPRRVVDKPREKAK
jgi:hypothetical protein